MRNVNRTIKLKSYQINAIVALVFFFLGSLCCYSMLAYMVTKESTKSYEAGFIFGYYSAKEKYQGGYKQININQDFLKIDR